ncbi:NAD-dependent succinate-semialdehyde dehydrogenase [Pseudonocardia sp. N23]|uniref:NAD-dependent succinate-semialdehyde dehydrogenase n=1 Tax=Pseudonocardia sp. N23 TaxID=1987376 RepID=UPI000BFCEA19|nr:NAD-dependent succinate-semialdehyde dehydrogenase [Pseudonocardia sp. N23]
MTTVDTAPRGELFVGGNRVDTADRLPVVDPATGKEFASVSVAGAAECGAAVDAAAESLPGWARTSPRDRAEVLRRAFEIMTAHGEQLARIITLENGKVLADSRAEVAYAAEFFRWFSEEAVRVPGDFRTAPAGDKRIVVTHQPVGVSLLVTPWNFPAAMATRKLAPALAAGCSVVLKPASETPLTALAIAEVLELAGVPAGVVNVVVAAPTPVRVREMLHDPRVRNLSFTGSTEVGVKLLHESADQVVRTSMELGGNAPFLVLEDADVEAAVAGALIAKLRNGGAACTAANRFYVHAAVAREFTAQLSHAMQRLRVGPGIDAASDIGSLVSVVERAKVEQIVDAATSAGARAVVGGTSVAGAGAFYPPTILTGVDPDADILGVEIFGPVAPVVTFESEDDAVRMANATPYGLISYVYSRDVQRAFAVADRLDAGMVALNRGALSDPAAPFGGMKESGIGREGGFAGIHEFLETKYIAAGL